jgi:diguanylate cyclase (GGDEF)-like protein
MSAKEYGIRMHVAWMTLAPLLVMVISLEAFLLHDRFSDIDRDLIARGQLIARQLAASSEYGVFSNNSPFLNGIAENALQQPGVSAVLVLSPTFKVMAATGSVPGMVSGKGAVDADKLLSLVNNRTTVFDNKQTVLLYQPIISSQIILDEGDDRSTARQAGAVVVAMNWDGTRRQKSGLLWFTSLVTAAFLLVTLYLVQLASRRIIEPVTRLSAAIHRIGAGNLETRVPESGGISELCVLANGINQMAADLQHERNVLQQRIDDATSQLRGLAFYDTLTLLPNRRLLSDRLTQAMAGSRRSGRYGAVMFLDLDNFKPLNDQYGHALGDLLLIEAARRISSCLRETDTVARFGGDEFVVMLAELDVDQTESVNLAAGIAEKIRTSLAEPYCLNYHKSGHSELRIEHRCTSSIGVALFLNHEVSQDEILYWADAMMYQAKKEGRNRVCFSDYLKSASAE